MNWQYWQRFLRYIPNALIVCMLLLASVAAYFYQQWQQARNYNQGFAQQVLLSDEVVGENPQLALQQAYLLNQQDQTPETIKRMVHFLTIAEGAPQANIRAQAKYAVGNLYFDLSAISGDVPAGGSHQQAVAQIALAREAYKTAIRLEPAMDDAKFNLELLDRLSPEKRTQAWLSETDGVTLQPFKRNGTARMRDNRRRGLP